jgi:hypothetical protein
MPSSGEAGKTGVGTTDSAAGQKSQTGKTEANTKKPDERSARHPESGSGSMGKEENKPSSASADRPKEPGSANPAAKPSQVSSGRAEERAKGSAGSHQMGGPERSGVSKSDQADQLRNRAPHENGAAMKPGRDDQSRIPERGGSTRQAEPPQSMRQAPDHAAGQPAAASQPPAETHPTHSAQNPAAPNSERQHEIGQGSSNAPGAAGPHAAPPTQKPQASGPNQPARQIETKKEEH